MINAAIKKGRHPAVIWLIIGTSLWIAVSLQLLLRPNFLPQRLMQEQVDVLRQYAYFAGPILFAFFVFPIAPVLDWVLNPSISQPTQVVLGTLIIGGILAVIPAIGMSNTIFHVTAGKSYVMRISFWPTLAELLAVCAIAKYVQARLITSRKCPNKEIQTKSD